MSWCTDQAAMAAQARELRAARETASLAEMAARYRRQRKADDLWGVTLWSEDATELQAFAEDVWARAYPTTPWPKGWRCRWAATYRAQTPDGTSHAVGQCRYRRKALVFDRKYFDAKPHHLAEVVCHEIAHAITRDGHGPEWRAAFEHISKSCNTQLQEREDTMKPLKLATSPTRIELRSPNGGPLGHEFVAMVRATEAELIRRCGKDATRWITGWRPRQRPDGTWYADAILAKRKQPLSVREAERRLDDLRA